MLELQQVERSLSELEVEEMLTRLSELNAEVEKERTRCEAFTLHYRKKILNAEKNFETDTKEIRAEIDSLTATLHRYAQANITGERKSIKFPSGKLTLKKQQPDFFIDGQAVTNDNPKLIELARQLDADLIATKEVARWGELKKRLVVDGDTVVLKDTGEVVPELRAYTPPDDFKIKTA